MNRKGYMFMMDVIIAIIISVAGFTLLTYNYNSEKETGFFSEKLSEDVIGVMAYTSISDLCIDPGDPVTCNCPNYEKLELVVCSGNLQNVDTSLMGMMSEIIETGSFESQKVKDIIKEIFVDKKVIDTRRFGFAVIYTKPSSNQPFQLYNSDPEP
jgi:hypothetical protein